MDMVESQWAKELVTELTATRIQLAEEVEKSRSLFMWYTSILVFMILTVIVIDRRIHQWVFVVISTLLAQGRRRWAHGSPGSGQRAREITNGAKDVDTCVEGDSPNYFTCENSITRTRTKNGEQETLCIKGFTPYGIQQKSPAQQSMDGMGRHKCITNSAKHWGNTARNCIFRGDASSIGYQFCSGLKAVSSSGEADSGSSENNGSDEADSGSGKDNGSDEADNSSDEADSGSSEDNGSDEADSGSDEADNSSDEADSSSGEDNGSSQADSGSDEADSSSDEEESNASSDSEQLQLQEPIQESGSPCDEMVIHPQPPVQIFAEPHSNATDDISAPSDSEQIQDPVEESCNLYVDEEAANPQPPGQNNELSIEDAPAPQMMDQAMALPNAVHFSTSGCVNVADVDSAHKDRTEPSKPHKTKRVDHLVQGQSKAKQAVSHSQTPDRRKRNTETDQFQPQNASTKESDSSDGLSRLRNDVGEPPPVEDTQDIVRVENECVDVSREREPLHLLAVHMEPQDYEILPDPLPPHDQEDQDDHEDHEDQEDQEDHGDHGDHDQNNRKYAN